MLFLAMDMVETKRLILRPIEPDDKDWFIKIYSNPRIMKTIYAGNVLSKSLSIDKFNGFLYHWQIHRFGVWMILEKSTQNIIGYCVFRYFKENNSEFNNLVELGYILDEPFWGNGYATEAIIKCIQIGFDQHHLNYMFATILPENVASQKVIIKAGMKYKCDLPVEGLIHKIYDITY